MNAERTSYYEGTRHVIYQGPDSKKPSGFPGGTVAAIAAGTLVIRLVLGLGVAHWLAKRRGVSLFVYRRLDELWLGVVNTGWEA